MNRFQTVRRLVVACLALVALSQTVPAQAFAFPTLSYGSRGGDVSWLQNMLNMTMHCNLAQDGIFGWRTEDCVRRFQASRGLAVDGIVGPNTYGAICDYIYDNFSGD